MLKSCWKLAIICKLSPFVGGKFRSMGPCAVEKLVPRQTTSGIVCESEACSEPSQTSKMVLSAEIWNEFQLL